VKTTWNDRQGRRDRKAFFLLVTVDGEVHSFSGRPIPGVCATRVVAYEKNGKWSNTTYEITHADTTKVFAGRQDWASGAYWPQGSWDTGLGALAAVCPAVTRAGYERFIRGEHPGTAAVWDAAAKADAELTSPPAPTDTVVC